MHSKAKVAGTRRPVRHAAVWSAGAAALALVGCGGGGSDGPGTGPDVGYTIAGQLSGLVAGQRVVLQNNGGDDLSVATNGRFVFGATVSATRPYAVTVKTQPTGQRCIVSQGSGNATGPVENVTVRCENVAAGTYTVGGTVIGLSGAGLVLQNNGRDDLAVGSNGGFTFGTALAGGTAYAVTVRSQPAGQSCSVRNGTGTVGTAPVSSVEVTCGNTLDLPVGDWKVELCTQVRPGQWGRNLWRVTRQGDNRVTAQMGAALYGSSSCSGTPTIPTPLTDVGTIVFDRNASTPALTAFWGLWTQPSGQSTRVVWGRKNGRLCLMADQTPSVFPSAASVESYVDLVIPNRLCYTLE
ncbi:MAG: DUF4369 domain-containing protein [Burkholderiaceae bacterium]